VAWRHSPSKTWYLKCYNLLNNCWTNYIGFLEIAQKTFSAPHRRECLNDNIGNHSGRETNKPISIATDTNRQGDSEDKHNEPSSNFHTHNNKCSTHHKYQYSNYHTRRLYKISIRITTIIIIIIIIPPTYAHKTRTYTNKIT
jgi:hypothetical protein